MINCKCGCVIMNEKEIENHFKKCNFLFDKYKDIDFKIGQIIKTYINSREDLIIIKYMFGKFIKLFDLKIKINFDYKILEEQQKGQNEIIPNLTTNPDALINENKIMPKNEIILEKEKRKNKKDKKENITKNGKENKKEKEKEKEKVKENEKEKENKKEKEKEIENKKEKRKDKEIITDVFKQKYVITSQLPENNDLNYYRACIFSSHIDNKVYIVYGTQLLDFECYDIDKKEKFIIIKALHKSTFSSCRYFYDKNKNIDLLITSCSEDYHIKVINFKIKESEIILDLNFEKEQSIINTCFYINEIIIIPFFNEEIGNIQLYNLNNENIGQLEEDVGNVYFIDNFFWEKREMNLTYLTNSNGVMVYNIDNYELYKQFLCNGGSNGFLEPCIIEKNGNLILIAVSYFSKNVIFWDFQNGEMISSMYLDSKAICTNLLNNNYIYVSLFNDYSKFGLININNKKLECEYNLDENEEDMYFIKYFANNGNEEYLMSMSFKNELYLYIKNE